MKIENMSVFQDIMPMHGHPCAHTYMLIIYKTYTQVYINLSRKICQKLKEWLFLRWKTEEQR